MPGAIAVADGFPAGAIVLVLVTGAVVVTAGGSAAVPGKVAFAAGVLVEVPGAIVAMAGGFAVVPGAIDAAAGSKAQVSGAIAVTLAASGLALVLCAIVAVEAERPGAIVIEAGGFAPAPVAFIVE